MSDKNLPNMSNDEMEAFIIVQQYVVRDLLDRWQELETEVQAKQKIADDAARRAGWKKEKLLSVVRFLDEYNSGAHDDWFAELGLDRSEADRARAAVKEG